VRAGNPARGRRWLEDLPTVLVALGVGVAIVEFYFLVYPRHGYRLPLGFDSSWYVWRARYVGSQGIGPLGTSARAGHAILSAVLGSVTGRAQLELAVLVPLVLVAVFALAVGGFWEGLANRGTWDWVVPVAVAGTLLGTTRLVSENVANLLNLALVVAAFVALARAVTTDDLGRPFVGAVCLLVGAGLAHLLFLGVVAGVLGLALLLALPTSLRLHRQGTPLVRTESGILAALGLATGGVLSAFILGLLNGAFRTFEIREDPRRFIPKLQGDLRRLGAPIVAPVAVVGAARWIADGRGLDSAGERRRRFSLRLLVAWTVVCVSGVAFGALTRRLPPHRFFALIVAVPFALAVSEAVNLLGAVIGRLARRSSGQAKAARPLRIGGLAVGVGIMAIPGALGWYHHGPGLWLNQKALQQAETAGGYVRTIPAGKPVVFLVSPRGSAGLVSVPLEERTIRVGMPPDRQTDVHVYAGEPDDLLAGRRSLLGRPRIDAATLPYWTDVRPLLPEKPPVLILAALAPKQFGTAVAGLGAMQIAPGVALLQGPQPHEPLRPAPLPRPVPGTGASIVWAATLFGLLLSSGWGWASLFLRGLPARSRAAVAPAFGAAMLMIGGLVVAKAGVRLAGPGGVVTFLLVTAIGIGLARFGLTRVRGGE
jgi:hypothetical protein